MNPRTPRTWRYAGGWIIGILCVASTSLAVDSKSNTLTRVVSSSQQFVAYATHPVIASAACVFAEDVKREFLHHLGTADRWRDPIIIVIREDREPGSASSLPPMEIIRTDVRLRYLIQYNVPPPDDSWFLTCIINALCAEYANRSQPVPRATEPVVAAAPAWLVNGLAQMVHGRTDLLLGVARRSYNAGRPQAASDLLRSVNLPVDPLDRLLFSANAWLFTDGLLSLERGEDKLQLFLSELGARKSATDAFEAVYGRDFPDARTLEKWWYVHLARRSEARVAEALTATETIGRLDEILQTIQARDKQRGWVPTGTPLPLAELRKHAEEKWLRPELQARMAQLGALQGVAHPLYRKAIAYYIEALNCLLTGKRSRFERTLAKADSARAEAERVTASTALYLDRVERTQAAATPGRGLTNYFRTFQKFESLRDQRRNPISDYLDKFDR